MNCVSFLFLAKCTGGCRNGGKCVSPETCVCQPGFEGKNCKTGKKKLDKKYSQKLIGP